MRPVQIVAALKLAVSCALSIASCIQDPEVPDTELGQAQGSNGTEPIGEAREALPIVRYKPSDFPFVTTVQDDGEGDAGGWQVASATLDFWHVVPPHWPRRWDCALAVEMPLRTKFMGHIPP